MIELTKEHKYLYNKTGFLRIKNVLTSQDLNFLEKECKTLCANAKSINSEIPVRCYDDIPYWISKGVNIATIENPFNYFSNSSIDMLNKYYLSNIASKLINKNSMSIILSRIHVTGKFKYIGPWHRDQNLLSHDVDVLCNIYLQDEIGMKFFLKENDMHHDNNFNFDDKLKNKSFNVLEAKAGDIVFLDPKLIHQPYAVEERMHIHVRYTSEFINLKDFNSYRNERLFYKRNKSLIASIKRYKNLVMR